jgi:hypothetical protein
MNVSTSANAACFTCCIPFDIAKRTASTVSILGSGRAECTAAASPELTSSHRSSATENSRPSGSTYRATRALNVSFGG